MRTIRSRRFNGPMARLGLLAVLLLALVPTLGRLAQARAAGIDAAPAWTALCTVRGLETVVLPPVAHGGATQAGATRADATHAAGEAPASPHGATGDCDYCPLLAIAIPAALATPSVQPTPPAPALCTSRPLLAGAQTHACGLGSRGPPSLS